MSCRKHECLTSLGIYIFDMMPFVISCHLARSKLAQAFLGDGNLFLSFAKWPGLLHYHAYMPSAHSDPSIPRHDRVGHHEICRSAAPHSVIMLAPHTLSPSRVLQIAVNCRYLAPLPSTCKHSNCHRSVALFTLYVTELFMVSGGSRPGAQPGSNPEGGCGGLGVGSSRAVGARAISPGQPHCCTPNSGQHAGYAVCAMYAVHQCGYTLKHPGHEVLASSTCSAGIKSGVQC